MGGPPPPLGCPRRGFFCRLEIPYERLNNLGQSSEAFKPLTKPPENVPLFIRRMLEKLGLPSTATPIADYL